MSLQGPIIHSLPSVSLNLADFPPHERLKAWQEFNSGIYQIRPDADAAPEMDAKTDAYRIGDCVLGRVQDTGSILYRPRSRQFSSRSDLLVVCVYNGGSTTGTFSERNVELTPSHVSIYDYDQSINAKTNEADFLFFIVSHASVGYDPSCHPRFCQIRTNSPAGMLIQANLKMMYDLVPSSSVADASTLVHGFSGLLQAFVTQDLKEESVQQRFAFSREVAIRRYVKENLKNADLNADLICVENGVSRAVLYRIFEKDGGVRKMIQRLRLEGAKEELLYSEPSRGVVARVAKNWTFADQAHFSRLFRQTLGQKPSELLGAGLVGSEREAARELPKAAEEPKTMVRLASLYPKLDIGQPWSARRAT